MKLNQTPLHPDLAVARARSMLGRGRYVLGAGGLLPSADDPQGAHWQTKAYGVDCSGFLLWCWGLSRAQRHDGKVTHINTSWIVRDARGQSVAFERIDAPMPGAGVVFGWYTDRAGRKRIGHCGLVTGVEGGSRSIFERMRVIHASAGNQRRFGYAIAETSGDAFNGSHDTIFVRLRA